MTSIAPWLTVGDGRTALGFYRDSFDATATDVLDEGGAVIVARLHLGDAEFWIQADDGDATGADAADQRIRIILTVDDPDAWLARALAAGATEVAGVHEEHGFRTGRARDPFGHDWEFSRPS